MKIVTLNIQGGHHLEGICREIKDKLIPFDILCLQEVCQPKQGISQADSIARSLGRQYQAFSFLPIDFGKKNMGNAFIINTHRIKYLESENNTLPKPELKKMWLATNIRRCMVSIRVCQIGSFQTKKGTRIRITNLHLTPAGGQSAKLKQINKIIEIIKKNGDSQLDFILGDFNTLNKFRKSPSELKPLFDMGYKELTHNIKWTLSASSPNPDWKATYPFFVMLKPFQRILRFKTDFVFTKERLKQAKCKAVDIVHSDHRAVITKINI